MTNELEALIVKHCDFIRVDSVTKETRHYLFTPKQLEAFAAALAAPPAGISPAPLAGSDERAAFEKHIRSAWKVPESYLDWALKRNDCGYYLDSRAADQWSGWEARAALSQGDVSGEGEGS
jgi:hypothetical protein